MDIEQIERPTTFYNFKQVSRNFFNDRGFFTSLRQYDVTLSTVRFQSERSAKAHYAHRVNIGKVAAESAGVAQRKGKVDRVPHSDLAARGAVSFFRALLIRADLVELEREAATAQPTVSDRWVADMTGKATKKKLNYLLASYSS
ncbi:hypothetical protein Trydic_g21117 [Trypoxylus dichotomus]